MFPCGGWSLRKYTYVTNFSSFALACAVSAVTSRGFGDSISMLNSTCKRPPPRSWSQWKKEMKMETYHRHFVKLWIILMVYDPVHSFFKARVAWTWRFERYNKWSMTWTWDKFKSGFYTIPEWCRAQAALAIENPISSSSLSNPRLTSTTSLSGEPKHIKNHFYLHQKTIEYMIWFDIDTDKNYQCYLFPPAYCWISVFSVRSRCKNGTMMFDIGCLHYWNIIRFFNCFRYTENIFWFYYLSFSETLLIRFKSCYISNRTYSFLTCIAL